MDDNCKTILKNKILSSLVYAAAGDAIGAATENMTFNEIRDRFGEDGVEWFEVPGKETFAYGNKAGQITDDFSQTYLLAQEFIDSSDHVWSSKIVENMLMKWSSIPRWFDHFAGPTTRSAIKRIKARRNGDDSRQSNEVIDYAREATNGAAMKISPTGLSFPGNYLFASGVAITVTSVTHNNQLAIQGACAVSGAIAQSLACDLSLLDLVHVAKASAKHSIDMISPGTVHYVGGPSINARIDLAAQIAVSSGSRLERLRKIYDIIGTGLHISEAVPAAFGIILICNGDPMESVLAAANIGYDTDTIACIVGSIVGAFAGSHLSSNVIKLMNVINTANDIDIGAVADGLSEIAIVNYDKFGRADLTLE